jgi:hypothetical protein
VEFKIGRECRVCASSHREEYDKLRFVDNMQMKDIWRTADDTYHEGLSYDSFKHHFRHTKSYIQEIRNSSSMRNKIIEESIQKDIEIVKRITRNLDICDQLISRFLENGKIRDLTPEDLKQLFSTMNEARMVVDQMLKWRKDVNVESDTGDIYEKILFCMKDFPLEYIQKFKVNWESYGVK